MPNEAERNAAWATVYDALSLAFTYPTPDFFEALGSGGFRDILENAFAALPDAGPVQAAAARAYPAVEAYAARHPLVDLESNYLALFELNRAQAPVHAYARLFDPARRDHLTLLRQLREIYRRYGLDLKSGGQADHPDHVTVELEFMAYLHRRLAQAQAEGAAAQAEALAAGIDAFRAELAWLPALADALEAHATAGIYLNFAPLLRVLPPAADG